MRFLTNLYKDGQGRFAFVCFIGLLSIYLITRAVNLLGLPIFTDEANYIHWSRIIVDNPSNFRITLTFGRQPLFHWLNALTLTLFADPLLAARIISVVAGLFTTFGVFLIGNILYSPLTGGLAALLYCIIPYTLLFDRIGHVDSLLSMFITYALLLTIFISRTFPGNKSLFGYLGAALGLGFITKSPALSYFILPPIVMMLIGISKERSRFLVCLTLSYAVAFLIIGGANIGVAVHKEASLLLNSSSFFRTSSELTSMPYTEWTNNAKIIIEFLLKYMTLPIFMILCFSVAVILLKRDRIGVALVLWFILPIFLLIFIGKMLFSRYILFCIPPAIIIVANSLEVIKNRIQPYIGTASCILGFLLMMTPAMLLSFKIVANPANAPLIPEDRFQYVTGWPSGYGLPEAIRYLKREARKRPITVFTTTVWGNPSDAVMMYLKDKPNITVYEAWWWLKSPIIPDDIDTVEVGRSKYLKEVAGTLQLKTLKDVYFVTDSFRHDASLFLFNNRNFTKEASFFKPSSATSIDIYKLNR